MKDSIVFETVVCPSHSMSASSAYDFVIDVSKSGYTPVGVLISNLGNRSASLYKVSFESNVMTASVQNFAQAATITIAPELTVIYVKNNS